MVLLPEDTLDTVFNLQRQLLQRINEAAATELAIFEQFGETPETLTSLKEVQKVRERLRNPYSRLNTLLLRIAEYQPTAPAATLNLLGQSISSGQAISDAVLASVNEVKRYWNL